MARKPSYKVDYFPHRMAGEDMEHIQAMFGNDGYAVWFKILERIASTDYHILDLRTEKMISRCASKCLVNKDRLFNILDELALLDEIDSELWSSGIIWSEKFIKSVEPVYEKRSNKCLTKIEALAQIGITAPETPQSAPETPQSGTGNTQSKVKYSKVKKSEVDEESEDQKQRRQKRLDFVSKLPESYQSDAGRMYDWMAESFNDQIYLELKAMENGADIQWVKEMMNKFFLRQIGNRKTYPNLNHFREHLTSFLPKIKEVHKPKKPRNATTGD